MSDLLLLVCAPTPCQDSDKDMLIWAAFYADCQHELTKVTAGRRLVLVSGRAVIRAGVHVSGHRKLYGRAPRSPCNASRRAYVNTQSWPPHRYVWPHSPAQAYNLVYTGSRGAPAPPDRGPAIRRLAAAGAAWGRALARADGGGAGRGRQAHGALARDEVAKRMALSLEHQYTKANLSFENLKVVGLHSSFLGRASAKQDDPIASFGRVSPHDRSASS